MRKKLLWVHGILIFFALFFLLLFSCFTVYGVNKGNSETSLRNYVNLTQATLDDELEESPLEPQKAIEDTGTMLHSSNSDLRITILNTNGDVLYDSDKDDIEENHLQRPEIQNLGTIYYRNSTTLKANMMYLAALDSTQQYYIRVSIPLVSVEAVVLQTIVYGSITLVVVLVLTLILDYFLITRSLKPLKEETQRLAKIAGDDVSIDFSGNEIENMSFQIDRTKIALDEKITSLTSEKEKLNYIINSMYQGLVVLDANLNLVMVNEQAKKLLRPNQDSKIRTLQELTISPSIHTLIKEAVLGKEGTIEYVTEDKRTLLITATPVDGTWIRIGESMGVGLSLTDITQSKDLEQSKRDFFANASHELKSPLTSIIGYAEMIKNGFITDKKETDEAMDRILSESNRMNQIVIEMLELSRLEAKQEKEKEDLSLLSVTNEVVSSLSQMAEASHVTLKTEGNDFPVHMAKEEATSLLKNLVENAIRYNKENGSVTITLDGEKKTLSVKDTGIGIEAFNLPRIYERFYRVDKARSRKTGGTGLGLSIVKHICLNNEIQIDVNSVFGSGTEFLLTF